MTLKRLLGLLPVGLLLLVGLIMALLWLQGRQAHATFDQMRVAQVHRDAVGRVRADCEPLTFKAVAWTLTRRSTQGRQYQDGKAACFQSLEGARAAMPGAKDSLAGLGERL